MRSHCLTSAPIALSLGLMVLFPPAIQAQSVRDVVERMYAAYERHTDGIENYSIVQRSMGASTVSYFEREMVDGKRLFRLRESSSGTYAFTLDGQVVGYGDVLLYGPLFIERGRYAGEQEIDGRVVQQLAVDDLSGLRMAGSVGPDEFEFVPSSARVHVDSELWIPVGFDFTGYTLAADGRREVSITSRLSDVRDRGGLLVPYHTVIEIEGLEAVLDADARDRLEELRRQLENMPPVQRQLMEEMMAEEMESLRRMMGANGAPTVIEVDVTSVAVNQGRPGR